MTTVLVVDDEPRITGLVRDYLHQAGFDVVVAGDGPAALDAFEQDSPDAVVLDLGLPGMDGLDVVRQLRASSQVPIVILTARADEIDRVVGLELGADDYVVKPFGPKELVARIRAVLRRVAATGPHDPASSADVFEVGDITVDVPRMRVMVSATEIDLTPTEFEIVAALAGQPGRVFTRSQLLDAVHGVSFESYERAIDAHVKNIRRKLEPEPRKPRYVLTVHGVGYRFTDA
ncbi:MAG: response regulator [Acidimicrobiales bacterium]